MYSWGHVALFMTNLFGQPIRGLVTSCQSHLGSFHSPISNQHSVHTCHASGFKGHVWSQLLQFAPEHQTVNTFMLWTCQDSLHSSYFNNHLRTCQRFISLSVFSGHGDVPANGKYLQHSLTLSLGASVLHDTSQFEGILGFS